MCYKINLEKFIFIIPIFFIANVIIFIFLIEYIPISKLEFQKNKLYKKFDGEDNYNIFSKNYEGFFNFHLNSEFKINQFNVVASNLIPYNRTIQDFRNQKCRLQNFKGIDLPKTSIVIVFHNEAWSTLLRTIWSIINHSPIILIKEIVLVDDASEFEHLGTKLDNYLDSLPVLIHLVRLTNRSGIVNARIKGTKLATGLILIFLDSHTECTHGWLQPLLYEIYQNNSIVASPVIDTISDQTFEFKEGSDRIIGAFDWNLNFRWYPISHREVLRRIKDSTMPIKTPVIAGGIFAISRQYFVDIGLYDEAMQVWGAENLEISFRVWMCGGCLLIVPCSHVGHVFRRATPYYFPGGEKEVIWYNNLRLSNIWMDQWHYFYLAINPNLRSINFGNISMRKNLRDQLKCKSFNWYLENIYPETYLPLKYYFLGQIIHLFSKKCLTIFKEMRIIKLTECLTTKSNISLINQVFIIDEKEYLRSDDICLYFTLLDFNIRIHFCHQLPSQIWRYNKLHMQLISKGYCLDYLPINDYLTARNCSNEINQRWILKTLLFKI